MFFKSIFAFRWRIKIKGDMKSQHAKEGVKSCILFGVNHGHLALLAAYFRSDNDLQIKIEGDRNPNMPRKALSPVFRSVLIMAMKHYLKQTVGPITIYRLAVFLPKL